MKTQLNIIRYYLHIFSAYWTNAVMQSLLLKLLTMWKALTKGIPYLNRPQLKIRQMEQYNKWVFFFFRLNKLNKKFKKKYITILSIQF